MDATGNKQVLTEDQLRDALAGCADEPIHIPGTVQPFGVLIGIDTATETIGYMSTNAMSIIGKSAVSLLNKHLSDIFDRDLIHLLRNTAARPGLATSSASLGRFNINEHQVDVHMSAQDGVYLIELEAAKDVSFGSDQALSSLALMIETMQGCSSQKELFDSTASLLQHISGYDRVMVYQFDPDYNGEVVAESKQPGLESFMGLRFPSSDIPAQARAVMAKLPLRLIEDVNQVPAPLIAASVDLPALDITFAATRGVSPVHMQYLHNMGVEATMTLSIVVQGNLWGMISFHHRKPRVPPAGLRQVLKQFIGLFCTKLETLHQDAILKKIEAVDTLKKKLAIDVEENREEHTTIVQFAPLIADIMKAKGVTFILDGQPRSYGTVPGQDTLAALQNLARGSNGIPVTIQSLSRQFPDLTSDFNGLGGALCHALSARSTAMFFRETIEQQVSWAGEPEKNVETIAGTLRLKPRSSFSIYLQTVLDSCAHWTEQDMFLASRIWPIIDSEDRHALMKTIARQQSIMINELNHRGRNIMTLVRSVSSQVERHDGSSATYAKTLEKRLESLAIAHDLAAGQGGTSVSVLSLIETELAPFTGGHVSRLHFSGEKPSVKTETAPIFLLVIHELTTNAAKYGALSDGKGSVHVDIAQTADGYVIHWVEKGGPPVVPPKRVGFGSTLVQEAVPHELGGHTDLVFDPTGLKANIFLPKYLFEQKPIVQQAHDAAKQSVTFKSQTQDDIPQSILSGTALVLEDSYLIAKELNDQLIDFGFRDVARLSKVEDALEFIATKQPVVAICDVHLGDKTASVEAALELKIRDIPFVFVTGYGDSPNLPTALAGVPILKKPVEAIRLRQTLIQVINDKMGGA